MAAEFAGVQWVAENFVLAGVFQITFGLVQTATDFGLAAWN
jgi:hypothetical protein